MGRIPNKLEGREERRGTSRILRGAEGDESNTQQAGGKTGGSMYDHTSCTLYISLTSEKTEKGKSLYAI
jgi:hypothetical protein